VKGKYSTYYSVVKAPSFSIELMEAGNVEGLWTIYIIVESECL
jgi:hypothetical protein